MTLADVADYEPTEAEITAELRATAVKTLKLKAVRDYMGGLFSEAETRNNQQVIRVTMNAENYTILWKHLAGPANIMEIETKASELKKGNMGTLWGAKVVASRHSGEPRCYVQIWCEEEV